MADRSGVYVLATGEPEVERLRILNRVFGPASEALLRRAGLKEGMRVVEFGCGSGNMTCWLAEQVGPRGTVVGIDASPAQVEQARRQAEVRKLTNLSFEVADAYRPGLTAESFDLAYCRLVLMHLTRPIDGLRAMRDLVKPGGRVVCEEMDISRWLCDPPSAAMDRLIELNLALGVCRGGHFQLGTSLHRLFFEAGFSSPEVSSNFPLILRGEGKRLMPMSFLEMGPRVVKEGLASADEVEQIVAETTRLADDETTLFGLPLVVQVWACR